MTTHYVLRCSVCNVDYLSKSKWLDHLTSDTHQSLARQECLEEWSKPNVKMKKCCLVIFSSFLVTRISGGAHRIIHHFSKGLRNFVTDFVWWEERPYFALLQLESRTMVDKVLSSMEDADLLVDNMRIQIKRAVDLLDLEWSAILPEREFPPEASDCVSTVQATNQVAFEEAEEMKHEPAMPTPTESISEDNQVDEKQPFDSSLNRNLNRNNTEESHSSKELTLSKPKLNTSVKDLKNYALRCGWRPPTYTFIERPPKVGKVKPTWLCSVIVNGKKYMRRGTRADKKAAQRRAAFACLKTLYNAAKTARNTASCHNQGTKPKEPLLEEPPLPNIGIAPPRASSDSLEYQFWCVQNSVTIPDEEYDIAFKITRDLKVLFHTHDPTVEMTLFRNSYVKLRNSNWPCNFQLLYYAYSTRSQSDFPSSFTWLPDNTVHTVFGSSHGRKDFSVLEALNSANPDSDKVGGIFSHKPTNIPFTLTTLKRFFVEAQICRLLKYLCTFDPRCHSLLSLTYNWAQVNKITFGALVEINSRSVHMNLPEPLTLEWLVIHFLCHKELIPTVRQIQERPHQVVNERFFGMDVGFHADNEFSQEWRTHRRAIDPTLPNNDNPSSEEFIVNVLGLFQEFLEFYGHELGNGSWILNTRDGEVISVDKFLTSDPGTCWSTKMTSIELGGLRLLQKNYHGQEDEEALATYKRCNYKVNFKEWNLYMVHPFVFTWKFSMAKHLPLVLELMNVSAKQLKKFLNMRRSNGITSAKKRFGTLQNVLTIEMSEATKAKLQSI